MANKHIVQQGDCLSSIAAQYGFGDYRKIYDDPANAELKKRRPNPNVLQPGDVVNIPDRVAKTFECATGQTHRFVVKQPKALLRLDVQLSSPHFYEVVVSGKTFKGKTDGASPIAHPIPAT